MVKVDGVAAMEVDGAEKVDGAVAMAVVVSSLAVVDTAKDTEVDTEAAKVTAEVLAAMAADMERATEAVTADMAVARAMAAESSLAEDGAARVDTAVVTVRAMAVVPILEAASGAVRATEVTPLADTEEEKAMAVVS